MISPTSGFGANTQVSRCISRQSAPHATCLGCLSQKPTRWAPQATKPHLVSVLGSNVPFISRSLSKPKHMVPETAPGQLALMSPHPHCTTVPRTSFYQQPNSHSWPTPHWLRNSVKDPPRSSFPLLCRGAQEQSTQHRLGATCIWRTALSTQQGYICVNPCPLPPPLFLPRAAG